MRAGGCGRAGRGRRAGGKASWRWAAEGAPRQYIKSECRVRVVVRVSTSESRARWSSHSIHVYSMAVHAPFCSRTRRTQDELGQLQLCPHGVPIVMSSAAANETRRCTTHHRADPNAPALFPRPACMQLSLEGVDRRPDRLPSAAAAASPVRAHASGLRSPVSGRALWPHHVSRAVHAATACSCVSAEPCAARPPSK